VASRAGLKRKREPSASPVAATQELPFLTGPPVPRPAPHPIHGVVKRVAWNYDTEECIFTYADGVEDKRSYA
jgi:hypothetical protein